MRQPWCNSRIGTFGLSYAEHTQAALGCFDLPDWPHSFSIAAASRTLFAAASATAGPLI
ncbi:MAG: hypothetical protein JO007_10010 [Alphaproteobacteria bacterium]|nr:hypothetical protein [Alphaproteobacteria bacterium]